MDWERTRSKLKAFNLAMHVNVYAIEACVGNTYVYDQLVGQLHGRSSHLITFICKCADFMITGLAHLITFIWKSAVFMIKGAKAMHSQLPTDTKCHSTSRQKQASELIDHPIDSICRPWSGNHVEGNIHELPWQCCYSQTNNSSSHPFKTWITRNHNIDVLAIYRSARRPGGRYLKLNSYHEGTVEHADTPLRGQVIEFIHMYTYVHIELIDKLFKCTYTRMLHGLIQSVEKSILASHMHEQSVDVIYWITCMVLWQLGFRAWQLRIKIITTLISDRQPQRIQTSINRDWRCGCYHSGLVACWVVLAKIKRQQTSGDI